MEDLDWTCCRTTDIFYKVHWVREEAKSLVHNIRGGSVVCKHGITVNRA